MPRMGHGQSNVYFANMDSSDDNQRNISQAEVEQFSKTTGKNLRGYFPRDQANEVKELEAEEIQMKRAEAIKNIPTLAATLNGNKPSRGAMADKEIMADDEAILKKMDEKKEKKRAGLGAGERSISG